MASEDALLLRSMRGNSGETALPLSVPEVEPDTAVGPEDDGSLGDLRDKYQELSSTVNRPKYRGFEIPYGMGIEQTDAWADVIDEREDERERKESFVGYQAPKWLAETSQYLFGDPVNIAGMPREEFEERKRLEREKLDLEEVKGEPEFVKDVRGSGVRQV